MKKKMLSFIYCENGSLTANAMTKGTSENGNMNSGVPDDTIIEYERRKTSFVTGLSDVRILSLSR